LLQPNEGIFVVADGMGGQAAGDEASRLFVSQVTEAVSNSTEELVNTPKPFITMCFQKAHAKILQEADDHPQKKGMGCTADLLLISGSRFILGHVGDSRTYQLRNAKLKQLTTDHSLVQQKIELGLITNEQARTHPMRNIILRAVGMDEELTVDIVEGELLSGDLFLMCTDGLYSMLDDVKLHNILAAKMNPEVKTSLLINLANGAGGTDNITVLLVSVE